MQGAIEMGFSLPNTENFPAFFENIKFGHQNMLLSLWHSVSLGEIALMGKLVRQGFTPST